MSKVATMGIIQFILTIIYFTLNTYSYIIYIQRLNSGHNTTPLGFHIQYLVIVVVLLLSFIGTFINTKSYKLIKQSFINEDTNLFNRGYFYHSIAMALSLITCTVGILVTLARIIFYIN